MKVLSVILLTVLIQAAAAQRPAPATVQGVVTQMGSGTPVADVRVELRAIGGSATSDGLGPPFITTGPDGRFLFAGVAPSTYRVVATKRGFAIAEYGQTQPSGPTSTL